MSFDRNKLSFLRHPLLEKHYLMKSCSVTPMYRSEYFGEEMPHLEESKSLENGVSESQLGTEILHRNTD